MSRRGARSFPYRRPANFAQGQPEPRMCVCGHPDTHHFRRANGTRGICEHEWKGECVCECALFFDVNLVAIGLSKKWAIEASGGKGHGPY